MNNTNQTSTLVPTKRQRSLNWLEEDKHLLMDLIRERVTVIENKNTDTNSNTRKQNAWADLLTSFNCLCKGSQRTLQQLKAQWGIIKMTQKKIKSQERKQLMMTGGGPPPPSQGDHDVVDISSWLPNEFVVDNNEFDSDHLNQVKVQLPEIKENETSGTVPITNHSKDFKIIEIEDFQNTEEKSNHTPTPSSQKICQTPCSKRPRRKEDNDKPGNYAATIAETEIKCRKELHHLQMVNEENKGRNIELKNMLLQKKIAYYEKKIKMLDKYLELLFLT